MMDLWLAPLRAQMQAMAEMQRAALALMVPPAASVTFPGDMARMMFPWAAWLPVVQAAAGMAPGPWAGVRVRMPMGTCGRVTVGASGGGAG
jgi:hypothetical protein